MRIFLSAMRRVTSNPGVNVAVGLIFFATGFYEVYGAISLEVEDPKLGAHHGAALFGLVYAMKHFPEFVEGIEYIEKSVKSETD